MIIQLFFLPHLTKIIKSFIKKSSIRRKGEPLEFLPLVRLRVLPAYAGVSGKTSFGIEQR
ncbi:hypothetical protein DWQ65_07940 [Treponema phagedenis]|nr:hypothetical protein C5O78_04695 [Treponema phagedenis]QSH99992.1 hypothetical protein DWQ65_07940 [Treponema phagedenis]